MFLKIENILFFFLCELTYIETQSYNLDLLLCLFFE
jgi:hypothetical protein